MKLPRVESLIIFVFFGCVALWGISKCSSKRSDLVRRIQDVTEEEDDERPIRRDTIRLPAQQAPQMAAREETVPQTPVQRPIATSPTPAPAVAPTTPGGRPVRPVLSNEVKENKPAAPAAATGTKYSTLFVTIDGLKVRKQPNLKGEVVETLKLYDTVSFLNQKSEKTEEISLGLEKVTDHWVKVRTASGKDGWVFGAGVHYYKMKRKGVM